MPINTGNIEGFDSMTAEEKVNALLKLDVVDKTVFDKKANEAAEFSRKLKAKQTDEENAQEARERAERENAEKYADLEKKYNDITKQFTVSAYTTKFLAQGYDEKLAKDTADALANGDMEKVFANAQTFKADFEKKLRADIMKNDPHPGGSGGKHPEEDESVERAKKLGKQKADADKATADIMKHYFR